jgi:hypothetical protein
MFAYSGDGGTLPTSTQDLEFKNSRRIFDFIENEGLGLPRICGRRKIVRLGLRIKKSFDDGGQFSNIPSGSYTNFKRNNKKTDHF